MREIEQYIKPAILGIIPIEIIGKIIIEIYRRTQDDWWMIIVGLLAALEIWLIIGIFKGIVLYVKRKDAETQELKENQEYMIQLLKAQRFEEK